MSYFDKKPKINQNFWFFINLKYISQHPQKFKTIPETAIFFIFEYFGFQTTEKKDFAQNIKFRKIFKIQNFEKSVL